MEPLYFYHLVNKDADLSIGLLSLKYMYDHGLYEEFDKYTDKYKYRIVDSWQIKKYAGRKEKSLTREEIVDALNIFRGTEGTNYIYFFKYPPKESLGPRMKEILKYKDIYRIDINSELVKSNIRDIFYGYDGSNSDNKVLTRDYYENISEEEYFSKYDDNLKMNFAPLNHIAIAFKDDYCPITLLEKI